MHLLFILSFFFFTYPSPTEIYTLSLHDALPILESKGFSVAVFNRTTEVTERFAAGRAKKKNIQPTRTIAEFVGADRKSTRLNSSHVRISYAVFCLKKKKKIIHKY